MWFLKTLSAYIIVLIMLNHGNVTPVAICIGNVTPWCTTAVAICIYLIYARYLIIIRICIYIYIYIYIYI